MTALHGAGLTALHLVLLLVAPVLLVGLVNRTRSWWAGRRGPGLLQSGWDLLRLLRKQPVFSSTSTPLFRAGAWVVLAATGLAALIAPLLGPLAPLQFERDFFVFAYALGLARLALMLSALDVGSAFEGMGAAREAAFTAYIEPALFLLLGTAALVGGPTSLAGLIGHWHQAEGFAWLVLPVVAVLFVLLQAEAARVPVDDPATHLELTMVHEVMILDHSGPELAAMQFAAALKLTIYAGLIAVLLNPFDPARHPWSPLLSLALMAVVAVAVGCIESLIARLRLRHVPAYLMGASALAAACLLLGGWLVARP